MNLPVVLCANKSDLYPDVEAEKEMMPIMLEFKVRGGWRVGIGQMLMVGRRLIRAYAQVRRTL